MACLACLHLPAAQAAGITFWCDPGVTFVAFAHAAARAMEALGVKFDKFADRA